MALRRVWAAVFVAGLALYAWGGHAYAATVWGGPLITFTEPAGGSGSNPANQDRITSDVWLTRNQTQGLFNAAQESGYTHFSSPADTEWAYGSLANYATLQYVNWEAWNGHNPPSMVDQPAVLHLISDNIYLSVEFLSWGGSAGGFSYERSTPSAVPEPSLGALVLLASLAWMLVKTRRPPAAGIAR